MEHVAGCGVYGVGWRVSCERTSRVTGEPSEIMGPFLLTIEQKESPRWAYWLCKPGRSWSHFDGMYRHTLVYFRKSTFDSGLNRLVRS